MLDTALSGLFSSHSPTLDIPPVPNLKLPGKISTLSDILLGLNKCRNILSLSTVLAHEICDDDSWLSVIFPNHGGSI
jgi:hypothetical protein